MAGTLNAAHLLRIAELEGQLKNSEELNQRLMKDNDELQGKLDLVMHDVVDVCVHELGPDAEHETLNFRSEIRLPKVVAALSAAKLKQHFNAMLRSELAKRIEGIEIAHLEPKDCVAQPKAPAEPAAPPTPPPADPEPPADPPAPPPEE